MRISHVVTAGALALTLTVASRTAAACTCAVPRPQLLPTPDGTFPASLPLLLASPPDADLRIEDAAGRAIASHRVVELPRLGLCETPWFLIAFDEDPVPPGEYRVVRGPTDADTFQLTAGAFTTVHADLTVSLWVETHDPITPSGSLCADSKIAYRAFSRTAHVSLALAVRDNVVPMFVTVTVPDPETPGGLAHSTIVRPLGPTGPGTIDLPLEDGAEACADVMGFDGAGRIAVADRLCPANVAANVPETHALRTTAIVPLVEPAGLEPGCGCAVAAPGRLPAPAGAIFSLLGIIVCAWRPRPRHTSTRTG